MTVEAMKMEIPVVAPEDGTVASIDVAVGDAVESGAVLATLNSGGFDKWNIFKYAGEPGRASWFL